MNGDFAFAVWDRREQENSSSPATASAMRPCSSPSWAATSSSPPSRSHPPPPGGRRELDPAGLVELHHVVHLAGCLVVPGIRGSHTRALPPAPGRRASARSGAGGTVRFRTRPTSRLRNGRPRRGARRQHRRAPRLRPARRRPRRRLPERPGSMIGDRRPRARANGRDALRLRDRL